MNSALKSVVTDGTAKAVMALNRNDLGGKTGTTNDQNDAWFSGFNSKVVTVVWLGFDLQRSTFEYGSKGPLSIWMDYMGPLLKGTPDANLPRPPDIVSVRINSKTGQATSVSDPDAIFEIFRKQNAPVFASDSSSATTNPFVAQSVEEEHPTNRASHTDNQPIF
jgi:penicillin-binding protein 1A